MPLTTRFFWGDIDLKWYPEACWSHRRSKGQGFYSVRHFMEGSSMPGADVLCIRDWRTRLAARQPMEQTTPLEIAEALDGSAAETLTALDTLNREAAGELPAERGGAGRVGYLCARSSVIRRPMSFAGDSTLLMSASVPS